MRIPNKAPFVLFQFPKGERVMFSAGPKGYKAFYSFTERLGSILVGNKWGGNVIRSGRVGVTGLPKPKTESFVFYRRDPDRLEMWTGLSEDGLTGLCRKVGDWVGAE